MSNQQYYYHSTSYGYRESITWAVQRLILLNAAIFAGQLVLDIPFGFLKGAFAPPGGFIAYWLAFQPGSLFHGALWQPFTYMFLHGNLMHLFLNMLWLYFFGPEVERVLGTRQFVRFYIACGALAVLATVVSAIIWGTGVSVTGASGAVMGVMVAYAILNPDREFFLFPLPVPINARALVMIVIAINVLNGLQGGNTSVATHFGGMLVGYAWMRLIPRFQSYRREQWRKSHPGNDRDPVGEAIDNLFKFEDRRRPR